MTNHSNNLKKRLLSFDRSYMITHSPWLFGGKILSTVFVLAVAYVFANYASPETYGTYKYVLALVGIISALSLSGLADVISREIARHGKNILKDGYLLTLKWHLPFFIGAIGVGAYYTLKSNTELGFSLFIIAVTYPLIQSALVAKRYQFGKAEFRISTTQEIVGTSIRSATVIASIMAFNSPLAIIATYYISELLLLTSIYWFVYRRELKVETATIDKSAIAFAKHMSVVKIFNKISQHADGIVIFQLLGPVQLAIYTVAVAIPKEIEGLNKPLQAMILPKVSKIPLSTIQRIVHYRAFLYLLPFVAIIGIYYIVSPYLFSLLFPQYLESIMLSQLAILILLSSPHNLYRQSLFAHKKTKLIYILDTSISCIKMLCSFLFIFWYGIIGAVYALLVARGLRLVLTMALLQISTDSESN